MDKQSHAHRALKNSFFSLLGFGWPIIVAILLTPIIVLGLGVKEYGIYVFISTLISLAGLLDVGASAAFSKFITDRHSRSDHSSLASLFRNANTILLIIGIVGFLGIVLTYYIGAAIWPESLANYAHYVPSFFFAGIMFFISSMMALYVLIPNALQRMDVSAKIGIAFFTLQQAVILAGVLLHLGINKIFLGLVILYVIFFFLQKANSTRLIPEDARASLMEFAMDKKEIFTIYAYGLGIFTNNIAGVLLSYLDKLIIPVFLGPSNLSYYSLAGSISNKTPGLSQTFASVIFPMAANFEGVGDRDRVRRLYVRSTRLILVVSTAITITLVSFPYLTLQHWISVELADKATNIFVILAITNFLLALIGPLSNFLMGLGKVRQLTYSSISAAAINVVLLLILLPRSGIVGAAWAYLFCLVPYMGLLYWTEFKLLELPSRVSYYAKTWIKLIAVSALIFAFNQYVLVHMIVNFATVITAFAISGALFIGMYYAFGFFEKEDVADITTFARNTMRKVLGK